MCRSNLIVRTFLTALVFLVILATFFLLHLQSWDELLQYASTTLY